LVIGGYFENHFFAVGGGASQNTPGPNVDDFQKAFGKKRSMALNNGHKEKAILQSEIRNYIWDLGWEYVKDLDARESIVELPE
jgi:hypothetical protein